MSVNLRSVRELIDVSAAYLAERRVESARLAAERLLAEILGLSRLELYVQHDRPVSGAELARFRELVRRRARGEPLQTLIGTVEFYSRTFKVEAGVFIPRPETERLVEIATRLLTPPDRRWLAPRAVEIGAGAGVVACSLAAEIPRLEVWATDRNPRAVELSRRNAERLGTAERTHFVCGNLFEPLPDRLRGGVDLLVGNPPYIRSDEIATLAVEVARYDPREALDGGRDGLDFYRRLAAELRYWLRPGAAIALEIGADQARDVEAILADGGAVAVAVSEDYAHRPRVVTAHWPDPKPGS
jgi:release factor glutamine methyltransferase